LIFSQKIAIFANPVSNSAMMITPTLTVAGKMRRRGKGLTTQSHMLG